jgi:site-specific recombinase XerD
MSEPVPRVGATEVALLVDELAAGDRLHNVRDSIAPNSWKAYQRDLADYADRLRDRRRSWSSPATIVAYLEYPEDKGAKYATIARRVTAIQKLMKPKPS